MHLAFLLLLLGEALQAKEPSSQAALPDWDGIQMSRELEFTNTELMNEDSSHNVHFDHLRDARLRIVKATDAFCLKNPSLCQSQHRLNRYFYSSGNQANAVHWEVTYDLGTIETKLYKHTSQMLEAHRASLDQGIFQVAQRMGFSADRSYSAAHNNIDLATGFGRENTPGLARFVFDQFNNPFLAMGAYTDDFLNAAPVGVLPEDNRGYLQIIADDLNAGKPMTPQQFEERMKWEVFHEGQYEWKGRTYYVETKSMSVRLSKLDHSMNFDDGPNPEPYFELRARSAPKTFEELKLSDELDARRIVFTRQQEGPILFKNVRITKPLIPQQIADHFYVYCEEMGSSYDRFKVLLPEHVALQKISTFLKGPLVPGPSVAAAMEEFVEEIPHSSWLRQKMLAALEKPGSTEWGAHVINRIIEASREASPERRKLFDEFVETLGKRNPEWRSTSQFKVLSQMRKYTCFDQWARVGGIH